MVTIDNSRGLYESNLLGEFDLHWDVAVIANGVDFGVVKGGTKSAALQVQGSPLELDVFQVQVDNEGRGVYGLLRGSSSQTHYYFGSDDHGWPGKASTWGSATIDIPLAGDRDRIVKIGFGETPE
jgi:hypothetical protein